MNKNNKVEEDISLAYSEFIKIISKYYKTASSTAVYFMNQFYAGKSAKEILTGEKDG